MNHLRKISTWVFTVFLFSFLASAIAWKWQNTAPKKPGHLPAGDYTYVVDYANFRIARLMKQRHLPSVAVALIDNQETVWVDAFGLANVEQNIPPTTDTVYKL